MFRVVADMQGFMCLGSACPHGDVEDPARGLRGARRRRRDHIVEHVVQADRVQVGVAVRHRDQRV